MSKNQNGHSLINGREDSDNGVYDDGAQSTIEVKDTGNDANNDKEIIPAQKLRRKPAKVKMHKHAGRDDYGEGNDTYSQDDGHEGISGGDSGKEQTVALDESTKKPFSVDEILLKAKVEKKPRVINSDISKAERYLPTFEKGLTAAQVAGREEQGYINASPKKKGKTYASIFFTNIVTFFNILTFMVGIAIIVTGVVAEKPVRFTQLFFLVIITANIIIGIIQEIRSKRMIDKLSLVTAPVATVIRDGERKVVPVGEIVLDDVIFTESGRQISADSVVLSGSCEVNESMLTGESEPVKKGPGDILYSGSYLSSGTCYARVDKIGENNYVETLSSHAKRYRKPRSELQNSIRLIMKIVACVIVPVSIIMLYRGFTSSLDIPMSEKIYNAVQRWSGAIIGMIPAGMFLLTSVALAVGVIRLAKRNTLVQDLYCIEMLARADVLCLDKTGTLTDGSMQVNKVVTLFKEENFENKVASVIGSILSATEDNNQTALALAAKFGYSTELRPLRVLPFSSQRKFSAVTFDGNVTYILGAPEYTIKDMGIRLDRLVAEYASQGYRVLALVEATGEITADGKLPASRKPLALIIIEDHIREDAIQTIKWFKENGVAVKIISGDNPVTVCEVAKRVGVERAELYISLEGLSSQEVIEAAEKYTVFGRVTPEQKSLLVRALKAKGHTVAMTGDGVNDILAMREADCSIAIASGAEAARNVSHLVLLDSNFTSMPDVVTEGRRVVNNITKSSSLFLTKTVMSILLSVIFLLMPLDGVQYPFTTDNLLIFEIFIIAVPSFALALQTNNNRIQGNFLSNVISRAIPGGFALVISVMAVYIYGINISSFGITLDPATRTSMWVLALSFTGVIVLSKICEPFNFFRVFVFIIAVSLMLLTVLVPTLGQSFGIEKLRISGNQDNFMHLLFLGVIVLLSYFIITLIMKILRVLKIMTD